jgi:hypothetical protein
MLIKKLSLEGKVKLLPKKEKELKKRNKLQYQTHIGESYLDLHLKMQDENKDLILYQTFRAVKNPPPLNRSI